MAELTSRQRRRGLDFADELAAFAVRSPDQITKREIYAAVNSIRKRYGLSKEEKKAEVYRRILIGASTIADIINETNLDKNDVHAITKELEIERKVIFRSLNDGEKGRPRVCIFPIVEKI